MPVDVELRILVQAALIFWAAVAIALFYITYQRRKK